MAKKISNLTTITEIDETVYVPVIKGTGPAVDDYKITPANLVAAEISDAIAGKADYDGTAGTIYNPNTFQEEVVDVDVFSALTATMANKARKDDSNRVISSYYASKSSVTSAVGQIIAGDAALQTQINTTLKYGFINTYAEYNNVYNNSLMGSYGVEGLALYKDGTYMGYFSDGGETTMIYTTAAANGMMFYADRLTSPDGNTSTPSVMVMGFIDSTIPTDVSDNTGYMKLLVNKIFTYGDPQVEQENRIEIEESLQGQIDMINATTVTYTKRELVWESDHMKFSYSSSLNYNKEFVVNWMKISTLNGEKYLKPIVIYPSSTTNIGSSINGVYLKDEDGLLSEFTDFDTITINYKINSLNTGVYKYDSFIKNLGDNVILEENIDGAGHSAAGVQTFNTVYPDFTGELIQTYNDPLVMGNITKTYRHTYATLKEASLISRPYLNAALTQNEGASPGLLMVGSHYGNTFERHDIITGYAVFLNNVIAVGAHRQDPTDHTGASSYGMGLEFNEVAGKDEMNATYGSGLGDLWMPYPNIYQQSPACSIVSAKLRKIKDATGSNWDLIRKVCRLTASNNGSWNMYTGYGVIDVDAAIAYINTNYKSTDAIKQAADNYEQRCGLNPIITYDALLDNSPISKKLVKDTKFGSDTNHSYFDTNGTLHLVGDATVFDDLIGDITSVKTIGTRVTLNTTENTIDFTNQATLSDYAFISFQLPHKWEIGSTIYPHIHWEQVSANTPNWLFQYRWQKQGGTKTTTWTNYKSNTNAFSYTSGTLNQISHDGGFVPPVGAGLSDIIQIRLIRDTANASGLFTGAIPYSGTASVTSIDIHYKSDSLGSNTEYTK